MAFRKIDNGWDDRPKMCKSPSHNPPNMIVLPEGTYEWKCPECGHIQFVVSRRPTMEATND